MKPWWKSLTIKAAMVTIVASVVQAVGVPIEEEEVKVLVEVGLNVATVLSGGAVIFGRKRVTPETAVIK
jgi:hypothetical protein